MKPIPAIVESAVDIKRVIEKVRATHESLKKSEARSAESDHRANRDRDEMARWRLEMGRELIEARKVWPARGPKAKGWGEFLAREDIDIDQRRAHRYMKLAGYIEVSDTDNGVSEMFATPNSAPDLPDPDDDWKREVAKRKSVLPPVLELVPEPPTTIGVSRQLAQIGDDLLTTARTLSTHERRDLAMKLRNVANLIEAWK